MTLSKKHSNKILLALFLIGISIRFLLITLPGFKTDIQTYHAWAIQLNNAGIGNFYSPNYFADYFPGYLYFLWFVGKIGHLIAPTMINSIANFEILIKITTTLFDLATAYLIYRIIQKYSKSWAIGGALIYIYNPALIFETSIWGQTDGVMTFFITLTFYFLLETKKYWWWVIFAALSFIIKPQSIAVFPVMFLGAFNNLSKFKLIGSIFLIPIITIILAAPFFPNNLLLGLFEISKKSVDVYPYNSLYAFNFWSYLGFWQKDDQLFWSFNYQTWGTVLFLICLSTIIGKLSFFYYKNNICNYQIYFASALSFLAFFLFMTRIHERYLYPFFVFFTLATFIKRSYLFLTYLIILSMIQFINLWYVYFYYSYVINNPSNVDNIFYLIINEYYTTLSTINIVIFLVVALIFITEKSKVSPKDEIN